MRRAPPRRIRKIVKCGGGVFEGSGRDVSRCIACQKDAREGGTPIKGIIVDERNTVGDGNRGQVGAIQKCGFANGRYIASNHNRGQV